MKLVSIIIPVYNVEKYLHKCLESLVQQTYERLEIVCVNDGSKDGSLQIVEEFAAKDGRIVVIDQENQGGSHARNNGMAVAKGDYLYFCDSDDYLELNAIEQMVLAASEHNAEIVIGNYRDVDSDYKTIRVNDKPTYSKLKHGETVNIKSRPEMILSKPTLCNKLFATKLIKDNDINFFDVRISQDASFTLRLLPLAVRVVYIDRLIYNYLIRENTISTSYDERILDVVKGLNGVKQFYIDRGYYDNCIDEMDFLLISHMLFQASKIIHLKDNSLKSKVYSEFMSNLAKIDMAGNSYYKKLLIYKLAYNLINTEWLFLNTLVQQSLKKITRTKLFYKFIRKND